VCQGIHLKNKTVMTRKIAFYGSLWVFAMLLSAGMSAAQTVSTQPDVPRIISYQASLADAMGDPLTDGDYTIGMALYNKAGDRTLWRDTYHVHASRGVVNVLIGSGAVPLADLSAEGSLWLGIRINGGEELPLTEFTAALCSHRSERCYHKG
jgi:hypothetical protein